MKTYIYGFILFFCFSLVSLHSYELKQVPILEAQIKIDQNNSDKFQPGFPVQIKAKVKNSGADLAEGKKFRVRYSLPKPYDKTQNAVLFETETVELPNIKSGEEKEIIFSKPHKLPTVADFIRYDWPMRQYQAIIEEDGHEQMIGNLAITYSAYFYEAPGKSFPTRIE